MSKNIVIAILLVALGILAYLILKPDTSTQKQQKTIDSLEVINKDLLIMKDSLKKKTDSLTKSQEYYENIADSLAQEASKPVSCNHKVQIQQKEIKALRGALTKCKEAKVIQTKTIGLCEEIIVNKDVQILSYKEMVKINKKEKRKSFLKGAGVGAVLGALLVLIVI